MANKKSKYDHVHKYMLVDYGKNNRKVFKCMVPGCTHFMPHLELALGQYSQCWGGCGTDIIINQRHLKIKKPMCELCKEARKLRQDDLVEGIGIEVREYDDPDLDQNETQTN